jgi:hypothetical protein
MSLYTGAAGYAAALDFYSALLIADADVLDFPFTELAPRF